jgi:hypothetical protein
MLGHGWPVAAADENGGSGCNKSELNSSSKAMNTGSVNGSRNISQVPPLPFHLQPFFLLSCVSSLGHLCVAFLPCSQRFDLQSNTRDGIRFRVRVSLCVYIYMYTFIHTIEDAAARAKKFTQSPTALLLQHPFPDLLPLPQQRNPRTLKSTLQQ